MIQPEQLSLQAHSHIQGLLNDLGCANLSDDDLTAVLRLAQHLRVFGLLSASGYVNQTNAQEGRIRGRTAIVWTSLLKRLVDEQNPPERQELMNRVQQLANCEQSRYIALWRRSLKLANHWNFWARAYTE